MDIKAKRAAVITLHNKQKKPAEIFKELEHLGLTQVFVYRTIKRFVDTQGTDDRARSGCPRSVQTPALAKAVRKRIRRNPCRKKSLLAKQMQVSKRTMCRIINEDLKLKGYRRTTGHFLTADLKQQRSLKAKALLRRYGRNGHRRILFTDEKIFDVEEHFNRQNDRIYARNAQEAKQKKKRIQRAHHPASVMVWWGVSYEGVTALHFCEKGVKTTAKVYQDTVLEPMVKPLTASLFKGKEWTFQQDSAPAHKAKTSQMWLRNNVPDFIAVEDWPSSSPDLNPLDYKLWSVLENMVCQKRHPNLDSLKRALTKAAADMPLEVIRAAVDEWPDRLRACIKAKGDHFE